MEVEKSSDVFHEKANSYSSNDESSDHNLAKDTRTKKKKGRPRNFPNIEDPEGALRLDVMNKTIIRAVRREYSDYFYIFCKMNVVSVPIHTNDFIKAIVNFINYMMGWEDPEKISQMYSGLDNLPKILGIFINY